MNKVKTLRARPQISEDEKKVLDNMRKLMVSEYYGKISFVFQAGRITHVQKKDSQEFKNFDIKTI